MRGICSGQSDRHGRAHRHRPTLEPRSRHDVSLRVARGMTLVAHHDALDDIASVLDVSCGRAGRAPLVVGPMIEPRRAATAQTPRETNRRETDIDSSSQHYVPEQGETISATGEARPRSGAPADADISASGSTRHLTETHRPMKMRPGDAARRTRLAEHVAASDRERRARRRFARDARAGRTHRSHGR